MESTRYSRVLPLAVFMDDSGFNEQVDILFSSDPVEQTLTLGYSMMASASKGFKNSMNLIGD